MASFVQLSMVSWSSDQLMRGDGAGFHDIQNVGWGGRIRIGCIWGKPIEGCVE